MTDNNRFSVVVVNAGTSNPSSTQMLVDQVGTQLQQLASSRDTSLVFTNVSLRELATEITTAMTSQLIGPGLQAAIDQIGNADGIIAATPVYKAGVSGLFKSFFDVLDNDLLVGKPVILAATAGTARHGLVVDDQMRSLFAFLRTLVVPTSLFAAPEDWNDKKLTARVDRAAVELMLLMESGFATKIREVSWGKYQHEFGSASTAELPVDFDSDLMRLATGGTTKQPPSTR